jgi:hypothetical protein
MNPNHRIALMFHLDGAGKQVREIALGPAMARGVILAATEGPFFAIPRPSDTAPRVSARGSRLLVSGKGEGRREWR